MSIHTPVTLVSQIYEKLEHDILSGRYKAGDILNENILSRDLSVSPIPIEGAIDILIKEMLVAVADDGSRVVVGVTNKDIADIYYIRILLEGKAAALACENIDDDGINELDGILKQYKNCLEQNNFNGMVDVSEKFNEKLYSYCTSSTLVNTLNPLSKRVRKYCKTLSQGASNYADAANEYEKIIEALKNKDSNLLEQIVVEHLKLDKKRILGE